MSDTAFLTIDASRIGSRADFHDIFAARLCFPDYYGRNMDAWIDCMSSLGNAETGMTSLGAVLPGVLSLRIAGHQALRDSHPDIWDALLDGRPSLTGGRPNPARAR